MASRPLSRALIVTLGCIVLSACISESTPDSYGVVAGHLQIVGGPANVTIPVAGSITIQGRYALTGHSPQYGGGEGLCGKGAKPVVVRTGATTSVDIACDML